MSDISKAYEPQAVEARWYQYWIERQFFTADPARVSAKRPAYSIVIPPPNVTGVLTMGHVLNNTIQDILARKARMEGKEVLWLPGTDHAGIATQNMVEKTLKKAGEIRHREDLGREALVARIWEWREKYGGIILQQLRALGASCDWTRTRFTMDAEYSRCVQQVFVDLYEKGLIYRGKRMVNWCPASLTALSDEEVVMKEQRGFMYHFKVEVAEIPGTFLTIATTRPETIPADTAVAVNPQDPRYQHLIGKHVIRALPLDQSREARRIPIIADEQVDFAFGTGVLKVTPAHDKADFEIGQRHQLPVVDVLTPDGKMTAEAGADLAGLERFAARKKAAEILEGAGALEKAEPYTNNVGFSERADVPIEPRLSEQWFLKYPSTESSRKVVAEGRMKFFPERWAKVYDHWMGGIQDWCISRQLWWGHRIPVWYRATPGPYDPRKSRQENQEQNERLEERCQMESPGDAWVQDPDVLDTWFSSWLWPFATMGWTGQKEVDAGNPTLQAFYPTTDLVTGPDIIFFWVARMIMAGYEYMGDLPFQNVYFTGIIRDKQGRKMSKTLGNSPDPLDLIAKYGADALRFGVMRAAPLGQDILFDEQNVELGRNFCNKLWNACRFRQMQGGEVQGEIDVNKLRSDDKWILLRLHAALEELETAFAEYRFSDATATLYRFFWTEYCDWYVESCKAVLGGGVRRDEGESGEPVPGDPRREAIQRNVLAVIDFVLAHTLRMFHPFLPFITEELWHGMGYAEDMPSDQGGQSIMHAPWPKAFDSEFRDFYSLDDCYLEFVNAKIELVTQGRNLRASANIAANKKTKFVFKPVQELPPNDLEVVRLMLNAESFDMRADYEPKKGDLAAKVQLGEIYLSTEGLIDVAAEKARLQKELEKIAAEIVKVEQKLANPSFVQKVPPEVLTEHRERLESWQAKKAHVQKLLEGLA
jgi:valyl-tRNA synthetase